MNVKALRAVAAVFLLGLLVVWLVTPIGNACGDLGKLPPGSRASSAPSFAPPLTRTCTYTTPEGTKARKRYVPVVDVLALALLAGIAGGAIAAVGRGGATRAPTAPRPREAPRAAEVRAPDPPAPEILQSERDGAERERAREERARRRR